MGGKLNIYTLGAGGVNITKNPHELADDELTQAQNAEMLPDQARGGIASLSQRGGITALTSALAGSVLGLVNLPLKTTYTRTLYIALQEATANTWSKTTNGAAYTDSSVNLKAANLDNIFGQLNYAMGARIVSYANKIFYPGGDHVTSATTANNTSPEMSFLAGAPTAASAELFRIPVGPSSNGDQAFGITDMIVANEGIVYFGVWDPPTSGAPDLRGRVMQFDPKTGIVSQLCNAFGAGTGEVAGGYPACIAWHQGQLFAGLNGHTGLGAVAGRVVSCRPDTDTVWTVDQSGILGFPTTMETFKGDLYVGVRGFSGTADPAVFKRASATGAYTSVESGAAANGTTYYSSLTVYNNELYVVHYESGGTPVCHVRKTSDGTSWSTDYDIDANVATWSNTRVPINMIVFNGDLFLTLMASSVSATNGFVLRRTAGSWSTAVSGANIMGQMGILVERT